MKKLLLAMLLMASPALAQTQIAPKAAPKSTSARTTDACAPIGRTAKGELVYSMKRATPCRCLRPKPARRLAPPWEPEVQRGGIFGWSYDRRQ